MHSIKPYKKNDLALWKLISDKISSGHYLFLAHAKEKLGERNISEFETLAILENKNHRNRKRNKKKDAYNPSFADWTYCIEGNDIDENKIRIIISFDETNMLVITVIRIDIERH